MGDAVLRSGGNMTKVVCRGFVAVFAGVVLLASSALGQVERNKKVHDGVPQDWSQRHFVFADRVRAGEKPNPRAVFARLARAKARLARVEYNRGKKFRPIQKKKTHIDWSVDLGATMAPDTFPAKYSFDVNAAPDCVNDFIVYGLNTAGSATKANLVGLNYLYTGPTSGLCNNVNGSHTQAEVYWAYQVTGAINTSTVLSMDGKKVAFLEGGSPAKFHVLAWKSEGTLTGPVAPPTAANAPAIGSGQMATVALSSPAQSFCPDTTTTLSSPFIDYDNDVAYVGADNGCLYRIKNVFCTTATCKATPVAPSLDLPFGSGSGAYLLPPSAGALVLGSPLLDSATGNIFVGSSNGHVYGLNTVKAVSDVFNAPLPGSGQNFGNNNPTTDIVVDSSNAKVYVYSEDSSAVLLTGPQLFQFQTTTLLSPANASIASGRTLTGKGPVYGIAFNDAFFSSTVQSTWWIYMCSVSGLGTDYPVLYRVGFDGTGKINSFSDPANILTLNGTTNPDVCAGPLTEFKGNDGVDRLFFSLSGAGLVDFADITGTPQTTAVPPVLSTGGATGIIIDNVSTADQASSIYYMQLGGTNAVKLTQAQLQ